MVARRMAAKTLPNLRAPLLGQWPQPGRRHIATACFMSSVSASDGYHRCGAQGEELDTASWRRHGVGVDKGCHLATTAYDWVQFRNMQLMLPLVRKYGLFFLRSCKRGAELAASTLLGHAVRLQLVHGDSTCAAV